MPFGCQIIIMMYLRSHLNGKAKRIKGKFLFLAHNTDFDYWVLSEFQYNILSVKNKIQDTAIFDPYGIYSIITNGNQHKVVKKVAGPNIDYGYTTFESSFDAIGNRLKAYGKSQTGIIGKNNGIQQNLDSLKGGSAVVIYKKKHK